MSKITRKSYKRKKIIMGAVLFGGIGLVSTGFAAWVLSSSATAEQGASLSVGEVSDKNMSFTDITIGTTDITPLNNNNVYHFEPKATDSTGRVRWDGNPEHAELMSLTVTGKITNTQNLGSFTAKLTTDSSDDLNAALTKEYVGAPVFYNATDIVVWDETNGLNTALVDPEDNQVSLVDVSNDSTTNIMEFSIVVKFTWGDHFGNQNPGEYYDVDDTGKLVPIGKAGDTIAALEEAQKDITVAAYLTDMHDLLDELNLNLTLTANPN